MDQRRPTITLSAHLRAADMDEGEYTREQARMAQARRRARVRRVLAG